MRSFNPLSIPLLKPAVVAALLSALAACTTAPRLAPIDAPPETPQKAPPEAPPAPTQGVLIINEPVPPAIIASPPPRPDPGLRPSDRSSQAVVPARPLTRPPPDYPAALQEQEIEGRVLAVVAVAASGQVEAVTIRLATHPLFEQAVRAALKRWRFEPARSASGEALPDRVQIPFRFRVE